MELRPSFRDVGIVSKQTRESILAAPSKRAFMNSLSPLQPIEAPIASVLIRVHNADAYLAEALESALRQTEKKIEVIVVDDGSTDSSREIVQRYAAQDSRVHLFEEEHRGLAATANRGLEVARGKYICILDADDIAMPNRVEKQVKFLEDHPDHVLVSGQATVINKTGETIGTRGKSPPDLDIAQSLKSGNFIVHSSVMYRRAEVLSAGGYDSVFPPAEDYDLWIRLAANCRLGNLPDVVCLYRVHENQQTTSRALREYLSAMCIQSAFRGASREMIRESVQADEKDFMPALRKLGYRDNEIAKSITTCYLIKVSSLNSERNHATASELLSQLKRHLGQMKGSSRYLAQAYSWEFTVSLSAHEFLHALRSLLFAFVYAPRRTTHNILRRLFTPLAIAPTRSVSESSVE